MTGDDSGVEERLLFRAVFEDFPDGMFIADVEQIEPHGGSLQVTIRRRGAGASPSANVTGLLKEEGESLKDDVKKLFRK